MNASKIQNQIEKLQIRIDTTKNDNVRERLEDKLVALTYKFSYKALKGGTR